MSNNGRDTNVGEFPTCKGNLRSWEGVLHFVLRLATGGSLLCKCFFKVSMFDGGYLGNMFTLLFSLQCVFLLTSDNVFDVY